MAPKLDLTEIGRTGLRHAGGYTYEEFLTQLRGRLGTKQYREMADNDPVIGAILYAIEKVIVRLEWRVDPYLDDSADGETDESDIEVAAFVDSCLHDMSETWDNTLREILSMLVFGWSYHEVVYKRRGGPDTNDPKKRSKFNDGKVGWRKMPIRSQETLLRWEIDEDGGIQAMHQFAPASGEMCIIPIEKSLLFRTTSFKNNPEGRSLLRNAFRPYFFKKRIEEIEAIGIERDLAGLPIAYVPAEFLSPTATPEQASVAASIAAIVQNIKRNEQEGVVFPAVYDEKGNRLFSLELMSSGGTRQFDTDKVISRLDQRISMSVLSDFLLLGHERVGSFALGTAKMDLWSMAVDAIAKSIAEVMNSHAIPRLLMLNGMDVSRSPYLTYGEVSHIDLGEIADYVQKMTAAGVIVTDPKLEDFMRDLANLPPADHEAQADAVAPPMDMNPEQPALPQDAVEPQPAEEDASPEKETPQPTVKPKKG